MGLGNNKDDTHGRANNNRIEAGIGARTEAGRNANNSGATTKGSAGAGTDSSFGFVLLITNELFWHFGSHILF